MDRIKLNRIELTGSIGALDVEKTSSQRYWVSIEIRVDLSVAGKSDRLEDTIDYADVFAMSESLMRESNCDLVETYADRLARAILERHEIAIEVMIEVLKPDAPIEGNFESVGIEITRTRGG